jgi:hypothetical protein
MCCAEGEDGDGGGGFGGGVGDALGGGCGGGDFGTGGGFGDALGGGGEVALDASVGEKKGIERKTTMAIITWRQNPMVAIVHTLSPPHHPPPPLFRCSTFLYSFAMVSFSSPKLISFTHLHMVYFSRSVGSRYVLDSRNETLSIMKRLSVPLQNNARI